MKNIFLILLSLSVGFTSFANGSNVILDNDPIINTADLKNLEYAYQELESLEKALLEKQGNRDTALRTFFVTAAVSALLIRGGIKLQNKAASMGRYYHTHAYTSQGYNFGPSNPGRHRVAIAHTGALAAGTGLVSGFTSGAAGLIAIDIQFSEIPNALKQIENSKAILKASYNSEKSLVESE